ncbi:hypothetical protein [Salinibacterium sp.]|uniref:hypothetical protein n=1 Tax=Salinibacterium sp. TaxID=1915057 RepID=UPI00286CF6E3|nr:hypothetical protein [Salinibacterium sp.]
MPDAAAAIRPAVDVIDELFCLPNITPVVIGAGNSDYVLLALSVCRLGRMVIGIGVTGSTCAAFTKAVDEFAFYADLPATTRPATVIGAETRNVESRDGTAELREDGLKRPVRLRDRG